MSETQGFEIVNLDTSAEGEHRSLEKLMHLYLDEISDQIEYLMGVAADELGTKVAGHKKIHLPADFSKVEDDEEETMRKFLEASIESIDGIDEFASTHIPSSGANHRNLVLDFEVRDKNFYLVNVNPEGELNLLYLVCSSQPLLPKEVLKYMEPIANREEAAEIARLREELAETKKKLKRTRAGIALAALLAAGIATAVVSNGSESDVESGSDVTEGSGEVVEAGLN